MTRWLWGGLPLIALLTACSGAPRPAQAPESPPPQALSQGDSTQAACGAQALRENVGERFSETLRERWESKSEVQSVRVIRPGQGYTMDYRPGRLNVHLDERGRIGRLECG